MSNKKEHLGYDIYLFDGNDPGTQGLAAYERFLDVLWLPRPLHELDPHQIEIINRYRERNISEAQFIAAKRSRIAICRALRLDGTKSVLEIGCGKFPIIDDIQI